MKRPSCFLLSAVAGLLLATGCSTLVNCAQEDGISVKSDPSGATVFVDGIQKGQTPVRIEIDGGSASHVIRLEKPGYKVSEHTVLKGTDPWVWGNAPLVVFPVVAAAGLCVDAYSGRWYCMEPAELNVPLAATTPAAKTAPVPETGERSTNSTSVSAHGTCTSAEDKRMEKEAAENPPLDALLKNIENN